VVQPFEQLWAVATSVIISPGTVAKCPSSARVELRLLL
jgi:hypothetical protein